MKEIIKIFLFAILIFCCIGCNNKILYQKSDNFIITIVDDEVQYKAGDTLSLKVLIYNNSDKDTTIFSGYPTFYLSTLSDEYIGQTCFVNIGDTHSVIKARSESIINLNFRWAVDVIINDDFNDFNLYLAYTFVDKNVRYSFTSKNSFIIKNKSK